VSLTDRLYYRDPYLRSFDAKIIEAQANTVYLDRTAFYPTSGGQPFDRGTLGGIAVADVIDEGDRIAHVLESPLNAADARGEIDWPRRFDHMQQHSGQHLLSAVLAELYDIPTLSFHLGEDSSTIDVGASSLEPPQLARTVARANEVVFENRPVSISFEDSSDALGLRKPSERDGILRIISIQDLDRSACGGTHVRSTGEIGPVLIRKLEKIRGNLRIEFLCGMRAVRRASADYETLAQIGRAFSAPVDELPDLVRTQTERAVETEKSRKRLAAELARLQGRDLYVATEPLASGLRLAVRRAPISEELRVLAQSFVAGPRAVFLDVCEDPPSLLLAASKDAGISAGEFVKSAVTAAGGRGGGNPAMAQGSVPTREAIEQVAREIQSRVAG
jgi:alanyl-tRNA synthetase